MHHLIYTSRARTPFTEQQLEELLAQARAKNAQLDVTGALLYGNEQFLQVLEGEEAVLDALYAQIRQDPRHHDVLLYAHKSVPGRAFAGWQMAYQSLAPDQLQEFARHLSPAEVLLERPNLSETDYLLLQVLRSYLLDK